MRKMFISFDFEGLAGVSSWGETSHDARFNMLATEQINAFVAGVLSADPEIGVTVCDSHERGENLVWEKLHPSIQLIKGYPRTYYMVEGLDATYTDFVLFGYHAPIGHAGTMDHSYSSSCFHNVWINDEIVGEAEINTMAASHYGVPLRFVYGDSGAVDWLAPKLGDATRLLASKQAISRYAAVMKPYRQVMSELEQAGRDCLSAPGFTYPANDRLELRVETADTATAYNCLTIPGVRMLGPRMVAATAGDALEMYRYLMTLVTMAGAAKAR